MNTDRTTVAARIRALFAQANSTTFPAEAAAFEAKALELMARHAIEAGDLADTDSTIGKRSFEIVGWGQTTGAISLLWQVVARRNRCAAFSRSVNREVTVVVHGAAADLDAVEALVGYLSDQLRNDINRDRPRSRVTYGRVWATRVGERLEEISRTMAAECRLPVPTNTTADRAMRAATPGLRTVRPKPTDVRSFDGGMAAGNAADLGGSRLGAGRLALSSGR